jgi:hypothetical protein
MLSQGFSTSQPSRVLELAEKPLSRNVLQYIAEGPSPKIGSQDDSLVVRREAANQP